MSRAWKILKEIGLMQLHSLARGTNYIVMLFSILIEALIITPYIRSPKVSVDEKIKTMLEAVIFITSFLIIFFFVYSPVREYIQMNWKDINSKLKLWKK